MATSEIVPEQEYKIRPVRWGGTRLPGLGIGSRVEEIRKMVNQESPSCVSELKRIAADTKADTEDRYEALGYLVALQNRGTVDARDLVTFVKKLAHSETGRSEWWFRQFREDALGALAHVRDRAGTDPEALGELIELAKDLSSDDLRRDALSALAMTGDSGALESLAAGVIEFGERFVGGVCSVVGVSWLDRARLFVRLLQKSSRQRNQIHSRAIVLALRPRDRDPQDFMQELEDFFLGEALDFEQDDRMSGILAELILACEGGDSEQAGHRINAYQRNHNLPPTALHNLRVQMGGTPALTGVRTILKTNLDRYFQVPIHKLNEETRIVWQKALANAATGYVARLWMSITVFALGVILAAISSYKLLFAEATPASMVSFAAGLGTMLLIVFAAPLKEIRQSVNDLASANAAFMAYVHQILETSHTFSYYYLTEQISFEELQKSSQLIGQAMNSTIRVLNTKAIDSAEKVLRRAIAAGRDTESKEVRDNEASAPAAALPVSDKNAQDLK